ncbi:MAG TPA: TonB-dependent receptor [Terriglobia bacterium]|nr:TonB-dependent receptor [Terriglobia bacterium]
MRIVWIFGWVVLAASLAFGQGTGTFNGRVVDQGSGVIPGAKVTVTAVATGVARSTTTNENGLYSVTALNPGVYDVKAENPGFTSSQRQGVTLVTDTTLSLDFALGVATTSETVEVTGEAPLVEITKSHMASNLQRAEVQELPMLNRTLSALIALNPGVREETTNMNVPGTSTTHTYFNVGGNGRNAIELVDGMDNHDDNDAGATMEISLETIQEFNVMAHGAPAEYGRTGGGVASLVTKSGTNQFHGSGFFYHRNDALTTIDYFSDPAHGGAGKPPYKRYQWGGSVGGPIKQDRAWFFGALERINQDYNLPMAGNIVALSQLLVPLNIHVLPANFIPQPYHDLLGSAKFDFQLNPQHTAFFRFAGEKTTLWNSTLGASNTVSPLPGPPLKWSDQNNFPSTNYAARETWVVSPTTVNEFDFSYLHYRKNTQNMNCLGPTIGGQGPALNLTLDQCLIRNVNFPSLVTKNFGTGGWNDYNEKHVQFKDTVAIQVGKHAVKFGGDIRWVPYANGSQLLTAGSVTFFDDPDVIVFNKNGRYPQGFATPGIVRSMTLQGQTAPNFRTWNMYYWSAFAQDDFKVTPRLTLNLGLRYDFFHNLNQPRLTKNRFYKVFKDIGSPFAEVPHASKLDFAPRVGLAWDARGNGKDVIRANFGIYYPVQVVTSFFTANYYERDTLAINKTIQNSAIGVGALANYVYGGPLPSTFPPADATDLVPGASASSVANSSTAWYAPGLRDQYEMISHIGWAHQLVGNMVLSTDYTHIQGVHEWRPVEVNPLCTANFQGPCKSPGFNGPAAAIGQRILSTATQAVYGDPNLLGAVGLTSSIARSKYDELAVAFQYRGKRTSLLANYSLSYAYGYGGNVGGLFVSNAGGYLPEIPSAYGGCFFCPGEWGPGAADERHRAAVYGVVDLGMGFQVSPAVVIASALPYQIYRANSPTGYGALRCYVGDCLTPSANGEAVTVNAGRGAPLVNLNTRVSKMFKTSETTSVTGFVELYNLIDRANFGANYGTNAFAPATFRKPLGYIGGLPGSSATVPASFQIQLGARFTF